MKTFELGIYPYIMKTYHDMFKDIINKYNITQIEIDVLAFLANNPEYQHAQDIVNVRGISKAHASVAIEKLVVKNYITREVDPRNRRCNILLVRKEAKELVKEIQGIQKEFKQKSNLGLNDKELEEYHRILRIMYKNLGGYIDE